MPAPAAVLTLPRSSGYIPTLDGWRAIAISGVILAHATALIVGPEASHPSASLDRLRHYGTLGVDIFFAISGLLITSRLLDEQKLRGQIRLGNFYVRRAFRILPPYFVYLGVVGFLSTIHWIRVGWLEWISAATFWRNYLAFPVPPQGWYTGHFWSLAIEEHFYLLWPTVLFLSGANRVLIFGVAGALAVAAWRWLYYRLGFNPTALPHTDLTLDALLWGCVVALLLRHRPGLFDILRNKWTWFALASGFVAITVWTAPLGHVLKPILIALLVTCTVLSPHRPLGRVLELAPVRWIGRMSYSLYIWQQLFLVIDRGQMSRDLRVVQTLPGNVFALFACALASYYLIERPLVRYGHRIAAPSTPGHKDL